jgi:hypothetical protein
VSECRHRKIAHTALRTVVIRHSVQVQSILCGTIDMICRTACTIAVLGIWPHRRQKLKEGNGIRSNWLRRYATCWKVGRWNQDGVNESFNLPNTSSRYIPSASKRNKYQGSSWEIERGRRVKLTISPPIA